MENPLLSIGAVPFTFPGVRGARCFFTTSAAGNMSLDGEMADPAPTVANRRRLMRTAGFSRWAEVEQVHGDALVPAAADSGPDRPGSAPADGQYTLEK